MIKRKFILGDNWLYYKLYCGKRDADIILTNFIKPFSEALLSKGLINQWFFIRYEDPKPHLRIRFYYEQKNNLCSIIHVFNNTVKQYIDNDLIWKVQTDTYEREIERYGTDTMLESEDFFFMIVILALRL